MARRKRIKGRRYADSNEGCANPMMTPCGESQPRKYADVIGGYDHYGYPIIRRFNLPKPYARVPGRIYGQASSSIVPMVLVAREQGQGPKRPKVGIAQLEDFKLRAAPSVPAAPGDLPKKYRFCIQKGAEGYFLRFRDPGVTLHGAEVEVGESRIDDETGLEVFPAQREGFQGWGPLCVEPGADKEPVDPNCCVQRKGDESGQLVCPGSAYDLLVVKVLPGTEHEIAGIEHVSVQHPDLPGGGARLPLCEPIVEVPEDRPCCIEEGTGVIVCPEGIDFPLNGKAIPLEFLEFATGGDGNKVARLKCGDVMNIPPSDRAEDPALDAMYNICEELGGYIFPVCKKAPPKIMTPVPVPKKPPKLPDVCCFDPSTNTLVCEGTPFHGLEVTVNVIGRVGNQEIASVSHPDLPDGTIRVPLCPPPPDIPRIPPAECCVIESSAGLILSCEPQDHPWNRKDVSAVGRCFDTKNGRMCVIEWEDEHGQHTVEAPVCPPPPEKVPPPETGDIPPPPPPAFIPKDGQPRLPPPSEPTDGRVTPEAQGCRERWQEMVSRPAKLTKCDKKWLDLMHRLRTGEKCPTMGRRFSGMSFYRPRRYGMGVPVEAREYGRFPGLRGGRRIA